MGAAMLVGGLKRERQRFDRTAAGVQSLDAAAGLRRADHARGLRARRSAAACRARRAESKHFNSDIETLSLGVAIVLMLTYVAGLFFSLRTHSDLFNPAHAEDDHVGEEAWTVRAQRASSPSRASRSA